MQGRGRLAKAGQTEDGRERLGRVSADVGYGGVTGLPGGATRPRAEGSSCGGERESGRPLAAGPKRASRKRRVSPGVRGPARRGSPDLWSSPSPAADSPALARLPFGARGKALFDGV